MKSWWRHHWWPARIRQLDRERADWKRWCEAAETDPGVELVGSAWGIIANASNGNWEHESTDWQEAAKNWRSRYHEYLDRLAPSSGPTR